MESIGQILKAARERRQMAVSDVIAATKMTSAFVKAIEADNFGALVAPVYARGFIKLYAECVGLDPMPLLRQFGELARAVPVPPQSPLPVRTAQASSKAPPIKAPVIHAGKLKPPRLPQSGPLPRHGATGNPAPLSWSASLLAGRLSAMDWTFISRVRWLRFKIPQAMFPRIQLPRMVWRQFFLLAGVALLIIAAGLAWEWSNRSMPTMPDACRWLAEPPAPYLTMEVHTPMPGR